jgi:hypothetical protein
MNKSPDGLRRALLGTATAGIDIGHDIWAYGGEDRPYIPYKAALGGLGHIGGHYAGHRIAKLAGLSGSGRAGALGDVLALVIGTGGSMLGSIAGKQFYDHRVRPGLELEQIKPSNYV